jgi:hypothetical protein
VFLSVKVVVDQPSKQEMLGDSVISLIDSLLNLFTGLLKVPISERDECFDQVERMAGLTLRLHLFKVNKRSLEQSRCQHRRHLNGQDRLIEPGQRPGAPNPASPLNHLHSPAHLMGHSLRQPLDHAHIELNLGRDWFLSGSCVGLVEGGCQVVEAEVGG